MVFPNLEATKDSLDTKLEDECARIARDVVEKHGTVLPGTLGILANRHDHACLKVCVDHSGSSPQG